MRSSAPHWKYCTRSPQYKSKSYIYPHLAIQPHALPLRHDAHTDDNVPREIVLNSYIYIHLPIQPHALPLRLDARTDAYTNLRKVKNVFTHNRQTAAVRCVSMRLYEVKFILLPHNSTEWRG